MTDLADRRGFDDEVYQPAEDSALLAGVVEEHAGPGDRLLDVGTGSGYLAARVADATGASTVGTDVNSVACRRARDRGVEVVTGDLTMPFRAGAFDVVAFNPPYLPATVGGDGGGGFETAVVGGSTGREVIERFLDDLGRVLAPGGAAFLLVSSLTGVEEVVAHAGDRGFSVAAVVDAPYPGETLTVLRLWR